ncbi:hypothetical protein GFY24_00720 [Nocardia sp. SYP-A9097]|uniref:phage minor head protein n=1 Tax=Nocardia sp. SYP-A9097 TaxID=2663237 RepID=UPI00129AC5C5|nr:phage minor head protein [Nocardia sp. SYP-A9097]MRH86000.1 hypothetical protein [Nocardia sp. SYP-A9097]
MSRTADPLLAARLHAAGRLRRAEAAVFAGVMAAMTVWLDAARALVLGQPLPAEAARLLATPAAVTAAADVPDFDAARAASQVWARGVAEHVDPALSQAFGEGFADAARRADISPLPFQLHYLETVNDRLKIWPVGAFEELRPELLEMLSEGMDHDQMTERIGRILNIDAPTRRIRAQISEIDRQLDDPALTLSRSDKAALRARKRDLWNQHDESLLQWQWLARRIARTETHGAMEGGALAGAQAVAAAGGQAVYKGWLATADERTRGTHVVAEGQIVKLHEPFQVGRARLQHAGEAGGPADEVINCRCSTRYLREDEVQAELQGPWGGRGVGPGHARIGPDDPHDAAGALTKWQREQRGDTDDHGPTPPPQDTGHEGAPDQEQPAADEPAVEEPDTGPAPILSEDVREQLDRARAALPADAGEWDRAAHDYRRDADGNLIAGEDLDGHLDEVLDAGWAAWEDIAEAMDGDTELGHARQQESEAIGATARIDAHREVARREVEIIRQAMGEYREFGGHQQRATTNRRPDAYQRTTDPVRPAGTPVLEDLRGAEQVFPREWLEAADARGELALGAAQRAFFIAGRGGGGRDMVAASDARRPDYDGAFSSAQREVMAHELGHRMEKAVPGLAPLEFALVRRRAMDGPRLEKRTEIYKGSGEYALADLWRNAYAGKTYADGSLFPARIAHEVFQVGIQDVLGRSSTIYGDVAGGQLTAFVLGAMLLLWPSVSTAATTATTATATAG